MRTMTIQEATRLGLFKVVKALGANYTLDVVKVCAPVKEPIAVLGVPRGRKNQSGHGYCTENGSYAYIGGPLTVYAPTITDALRAYATQVSAGDAREAAEFAIRTHKSDARSFQRDARIGEKHGQREYAAESRRWAAEKLAIARELRTIAATL